MTRWILALYHSAPVVVTAGPVLVTITTAALIIMQHHLFASSATSRLVNSAVSSVVTSISPRTLFRLLCPVVYHNLSTYSTPYLIRQQPSNKNGRSLG